MREASYSCVTSEGAAKELLHNYAPTHEIETPCQDTTKCETICFIYHPLSAPYLQQASGQKRNTPTPPQECPNQPNMDQSIK